MLASFFAIESAVHLVSSSTLHGTGRSTVLSQDRKESIIDQVKVSYSEHSPNTYDWILTRCLEYCVDKLMIGSYAKFPSFIVRSDLVYCSTW